MPELPEVETVRRGIAPQLIGQRVTQVVIHQARLRWPISPEIVTAWPGQVIERVERRAKYLLLGSAGGTAIFHLGMTGKLRVVAAHTPLQKHDHVEVFLSDGCVLRFNDSRRFGCLLWTTQAPQQHPLLAKLGVEPLQPACDAHWLWEHAQGRSIAVKSFIMDQQVVVGVGNIYASEALFAARINPLRSANQVTLVEYERLVSAIRRILNAALQHGGSTVRDFVGACGERGAFQEQLLVYDRYHQPCRSCATPIERIRQGQRSTYYCPQCQR